MKPSRWCALVAACCVPCFAEVLDEWGVDDFGLGDVNVAAATTEEDFTKNEVRGFSIYVEKTLEESSPDDVTTFLELAEANLTRLEPMVRPEDLARLRTVNIWLTDNTCGRAAGWFHRSTAGPWLERNGRPTAMAGGTEFCRADYLVKNDTLSNYLLHELAHGFHHHYLTDGFDNDVIEDAYERQDVLQLYYHVLDADGRYDEAHANSNAIEYFAHLSTKYLGTDDEFPFVRAELRHHDSWGWQVTDAAWTDTLESEWLDCDRIGSVQSVSGKNRVALNFSNTSDELRYLIWIDYSGAVRWDFHEWIAPAGGAAHARTRRGEFWVAFDEGKECLGVFKAGIKSETVDIRSPKVTRADDHAVRRVPAPGVVSRFSTVP